MESLVSKSSTWAFAVTVPIRLQIWLYVHYYLLFGLRINDLF